MCSAQVSEKNSAAGLKGAPRWHVVSARALPGFRLEVQFADGLSGLVEMGGLISSTDAGVFARLRETSAFEAVRVEHGAVTWPDDLDLAPDAMYEEIRKHGSWIVR